MPTFVYPTSAEITEIAQDKLPRLTTDRVGFQILPMEDVDSSVIIWDQLDNYTGLQELRGEGASFPLIQQVGSKQYVERPGFYGEGKVLDEIMLLERRQRGTFGTPIEISDLVMEAQDHLLGRRLDRIEWIIWKLLVFGTFAVSTKNGVLAHQGTYPVQSYTAPVTWATSATASPLADFSAVQLLARGHSVNLGAEAIAYMNRVTFNSFRTNTNSADVYGRRVGGLATANNLGALNELLTGDDLPTVAIYDEGYQDSTNTFQPYIPNNKIVVVGKRPAGQPVGKYLMTRNASEPSMAPGAYMWTQDNRGEDSDGNAPSIVVYDSHNGGPTIQYPSAVLVMTV